MPTYEDLLKRYGSPEAVSEEMRRRGQNSPRNKGKEAYFKRLARENPKLLKSIAQKGVERRRHGQTSTSVSDNS